jgi:hypothetical protein
VESLAMDFSGPSSKEKVLEKNRCSDMRDRYVAGSVDRRQRKRLSLLESGVSEIEEVESSTVMRANERLVFHELQCED